MPTAEDHITRLNVAGYPVTGAHRQRDIWVVSARVGVNQFSTAHGPTLTAALAALDKLLLGDAAPGDDIDFLG